MKIFTKRRVLISAVVIIIFSALIFLFSHSTYYKYNDWWVKGRSLAEIEERYGDFDIRLGSTAGYYIYTDNGWIMPDHLPHYYYMEYDENGIVRRVYEGLHPGG